MDLVSVDHSLSAAVESLRWSPLTAVMTFASFWWVKAFAFVIPGLVEALRRRLLPVRALVVAVAFGLSSVVSTSLKLLVDRARPDGGALVDLPSSASFPSGHATTAFAAAVACGLLFPRLRWPALGLAATIALSRVYLGVHYAFDVLAGAAIGALVGWLVVRAFGYATTVRAPGTTENSTSV